MRKTSPRILPEYLLEKGPEEIKMKTLKWLVLFGCLFYAIPAHADYLNLQVGPVVGGKSLYVSWQGHSGRTFKLKWRKRNSGLQWGGWSPTQELTQSDVQVSSNNFWNTNINNLQCNTQYQVKVKMKGRGWKSKTVSTSGCGTTPCPKGGWFDSANCQVGKAPAGTTAFIWGGNYYYTPISGNQCPYPGSWYDGANCFVQKVPTGVVPFIYKNHWYYKAYP